MRQILYVLAAGVTFILILAGIKYWLVSNEIADQMAMKRPPETVTSLVVKEIEWPALIRATASLLPVQGVVLSAEQPGRLSKISAENGSNVVLGQAIMEFDTSVEEADLRATEAKGVRAKRTFERAKTLRASNATSQAELESAEADYRQAIAQADSLRASIAKKNISAPFAGKLGIREVNIGQYVIPGTALIPLYAADSLYAAFVVPQQLAASVKAGQEVTLTTDALPGAIFKGSVHAVNPNIDSTTRTLAVQALFSNSEGKLMPGAEIATSGVFKLQPGAAVATNNAFAPGNSQTPEVQDR